ncbi:MAG: hypothetical protein K2M90_00755 [Treponemataceae bacterium]|nr:hypothetical protein [Treponemataceae bacterium]
MNLLDISREMVAVLFPEEEWTEAYGNVFVASSRKPKNSEQKKVFEKEFDMARIAADKGHTIFLLPALESHKNPDALFVADFTEFKHVTGGENAISHRFRDALHQGRSVYLKIDSGAAVRRIKQILAGVLKTKDNAGKVYCYVTRLDVMYTWNMRDLKQSKAPDGASLLPQAD